MVANGFWTSALSRCFTRKKFLNSHAQKIPHEVYMIIILILLKHWKLVTCPRLRCSKWWTGGLHPRNLAPDFVCCSSMLYCYKWTWCLSHAPELQVIGNSFPSIWVFSTFLSELTGPCGLEIWSGWVSTLNEMSCLFSGLWSSSVTEKSSLVPASKSPLALTFIRQFQHASQKNSAILWHHGPWNIWWGF